VGFELGLELGAEGLDEFQVVGGVSLVPAKVTGSGMAGCLRTCQEFRLTFRYMRHHWGHWGIPSQD
jgi:hypothetical protein